LTNGHAVSNSLFQHYLKSSIGITVNEIVKSGSLGHGTAVPGDFDLDLVLYSQGEFYHFKHSQIDSEHIHRVSAMDIKAYITLTTLRD